MITALIFIRNVFLVCAIAYSSLSVIATVVQEEKQTYLLYLIFWMIVVKWFC